MGQGIVREPGRPAGRARLRHRVQSGPREFRNVCRPGDRQVRVDRVLVAPSGVHVVTHAHGPAADPGPSQVRSSAESAATVAALLPERYRDRVRAVLCRYGTGPLAEQVDGVWVTSPDTLEHIVHSLPPVLSTSEMGVVAGSLAASLEPFPEAPGAVRRRTLWWSRAAAAVVGAAAAAMLVLAALLADSAVIPWP